MPDEIGLFRTTGPSWSERSSCGELNASLSPNGSQKRNLYLHGITTYASQKALSIISKNGVIVDFGCGTGRIVRFFGKRGHRVFGMDITPEMLEEAKKIGIPPDSKLMLIDGINIPLESQSVNLIWVCGVLRFSLLIENPVYRQIADEMFRVLKPGGFVFNVEMYVDQPFEVFIRDFEDAGFCTKQMKVLQRYGGPLERFAQASWLPLSLVVPAARLCAYYRYHFDYVTKPHNGLRDYLFVWHKENSKQS